MTFFKETEQNNNKICMEPQKTPNSQSNPEKKINGARGITLPDFRLYHKVIISKQQDNGRKTDRDQWNRIEGPDITPQEYGEIIFNKGTKTYN